MDAERTPSRRTVLRGAGATGLGVSSLLLPSAAASASPQFTTGQGDASLAMFLDATNAASWSGTGNWNDLTGNGRSLSPGVIMTHRTTELDGSSLGITGGTGAFVFSGDGGVIPNATVPAFAYGPAWSIAVWVRFRGLAGWQSFVGHGDRLDNAVYFQKALDGLGTETTNYGTTRSSNRVGVAFGGRGGGQDLFAYGPTPVTAGVWYHVVVTASPSFVRIHVDGAVVADVSGALGTYGGSLAPATGTVTTVIGNRIDDQFDPLRGALAFLQIWTRELTASEVAAQYVATKGPYRGA
jgi:hypothetical protein